MSVPYAPRPLQRAIHDRPERFVVLVCHRRFGKTVLAINKLLRAAMENDMDRPRYAYIAPLYKQAKTVAWDYVKHFAGVIPGTRFHETELRCDLPNGARLTLLGADRPDRLRGIYLDGAVLDEMAQMPPRLWGEVIRPALSDRQGWALFIGTPRGKNAFYDLYRHAQKDPAWHAALYPASATGVMDADELARARSEMTPEQYEQEFECSFSAAVVGAYYAGLIDAAEREHRITRVPADPALPVHTAWDLGMSDATAIWFFQTLNTGEVRLIDYAEDRGHGLDHYARLLADKGHAYGLHIAPHDISVRELGTGKSRLEVAQALGIRFVIAPRLNLADGINAARALIPRCWFNQSTTQQGLEALRQYRADFDDKRDMMRPYPVHDWTSHAADAFRYLACGEHLARQGANAMTCEEADRLYEAYAPPRR